MPSLLPARASALLLACGLSACASSDEPRQVLPPAERLAVDTLPGEPSLRGLCAVSAEVAWVSGSGPTVAVTRDGGQSWEQVTPRQWADETTALDVRDVHALDGRTAWILSAGPGAASRILRTDDGGATWAEEHREKAPESFLDGFAMRPDGFAVAYGDPLPGVGFRVLLRDPATGRWRPAVKAPQPHGTGEAAFAASGTGIRVRGNEVMFVTGASDRPARVLRSADLGGAWAASELPMPAAKPAEGAFSLSLGPDGSGVVVGGDFTARERGGTRCAAFTTDGGKTWSAPEVGPRGQRAGSCAIPGGRFLATGQTGTDATRDGGRTWEAFSDEGFHCVDAAPDGTVWFAGHRGRVARLR